jgi:molecular chaperone Hsp31 and glyoxalase 3
MAMAVKQTTDFKAAETVGAHTGGGKVLVVCCEDGKFTMANGKVFNSGNHPAEVFVPLLHLKAAGFGIEFATISGRPVVLEMWAFPKKDANVQNLYDECKSKGLLEKPVALDAVDASLSGYAGIFLPGGHGAMIGLPESPALGRLLHTAHKKSLPTIALCHGPAALMAASKVDGEEFPYKGYKAVSFSDKTDGVTPKIGYLPGPMPWFQQEALTKQGMEMLNKAESGAVNVDRELITGDSPDAADKLGKLAATLLVEAWEKSSNGI